MTLAEAMRRARSNLYRFEENAEMLERKDSLVDMIRERGSRVEQQYEEKPGKVSAHYIEAVPSWFLALDNAERAYYELQDAVRTVRSLTECLEKYQPVSFALYAAKYRDGQSLPELRRRFGRKLKILDQDLIFRLIDWSTWPVDRDGEEYHDWKSKK